MGHGRLPTRVFADFEAHRPNAQRRTDSRCLVHHAPRRHHRHPAQARASSGLRPHRSIQREAKYCAVSPHSTAALQQQQDTFADLLPLFRKDPTGPEDFIQTFFYVKGRMEAEKLQDFLRDNRPDSIAPEVFEFYHRHIDENRKAKIIVGINNGSLRGVSATDALGMVCVAIHSMKFVDRSHYYSNIGYALPHCAAGDSVARTADLYVPYPEDWQMRTGSDDARRGHPFRD